MEILIPLAFFAMIAAIVLIPVYLRERTKQSAHQLIAQALEKGQPLDTALIDRLTQTTAPKPQQQNSARKTLGNGIILLALALGFGVAGVLDGDFDPIAGEVGGMVVAALILGVLGTAFIVLAIVDYNSKKNVA
ncbi:MAG: DUF6249 domain-containing protein [Hyphomonadaceae bacterium]|nr:DUF6249 domain-containing protein [Hyphomonadaceae bacterium]